jgi:hypothetical protein
MWKNANKPSSGFLHHMRRQTRADYHRAVKLVKNNEDVLRSEMMIKSIQANNSRKFWSEIKRFRGRSTHTPNCVDGAVGNTGVAEVFASKFKSVFNCYQ